MLFQTCDLSHTLKLLLYQTRRLFLARLQRFRRLQRRARAIARLICRNLTMDKQYISPLPDFMQRATRQLNGWITLVHLDWYRLRWKLNSTSTMNKRKITENVNVRQEKGGSHLFSCFLNSVNNFRISRITELLQNKELINTELSLLFLILY